MMVLVGHYRMGVVLGRGKFGWVSRATHHIIGQPVAVKHQPWPVGGLSCGGEADQHKDCQHVEVKKCHAALENEAELLAQVSHPSIVALVEVVRGPFGVHICLEDLGDTNLCSLVQQHYESKNTGLSESFASAIFQQVGAGLQHLHNQGIVHRDVKPENIMVISGSKFSAPTAKLIDLGLATVWGPSSPLNTARTRVGTVIYLAPELTSSAHSYGPEVDVFSLGASLYYTLIGETPFTEYKRNGLMGTTSVFGFQLHHEDAIDTLSHQAGVVLRAMMETNPKKRWTLSKLMEQDWFKYPVSDVGEEDVANSILCKSNSASLKDHNSDSDDLLFTLRQRESRPKCSFGSNTGMIIERFNHCNEINTSEGKQSSWIDMQCVDTVSSLLKKDLEDVLHQLWEEPWGPVGGMYNLLLQAGEQTNSRD